MEDDIKVLIGLEGLQQYLADVQKAESVTKKSTAGSNQSLKQNANAWKDLQREVPLVGKAVRLANNPIAASVAVVTALTGAIVSATKAADEQIRVETQLDTVLKSTGGAAGLTATQLKEYASSLQDVTTFGDEAIIGAENILLTFKNIRGQNFLDATKSVLDLATALKIDLKSASIQVGKALNDPATGLTALSRAGITFSDQQKQLIKDLQASGQAAEAQRIILKELEEQFGGSAEAAAKAGLGGFKQLQNTIGDIKEDIGFAFIPIAQELADILKFLIDPLTDNRELFVKLGETAGELFNGFIDISSSLGEILVASGLVDDDFNIFTETLEYLITVIKNYVDVIKAVADGFKLVAQGVNLAKDAAFDFSDAIGITSKAAEENRERLLNIKDAFFDYGSSLGLSVQQTREFIVNQKDLSDAVAGGKLSTSEALKIGRERLLAYANDLTKVGTITENVTGKTGDLSTSINGLNSELKAYQDLIKTLDPGDVLFSKTAANIARVKSELELLNERIKILGTGFDLETIDVSINPVLDKDAIRENLDDVFGDNAFQESLNAFTDTSTENIKSKFGTLFEQLKEGFEEINPKEFITNAVASLDKLAFKLGETAGAGKDLSAVIGGFVKDLLVEIPKLIGYALIASATTPKAISTFPANLALIAAGLGLIGASGLISGLLSSIDTDSTSPTASEPSFGGGGGAIGTGLQTGLGGFGEDGGGITTNVIVTIDGDEVASKVTEKTELNNELRAR